MCFSCSSTEWSVFFSLSLKELIFESCTYIGRGGNARHGQKHLSIAPQQYLLDIWEFGACMKTHTGLRGVCFCMFLLARKIVRDKTSWCNRLRKVKGIDIFYRFCHAMLAMLMK